MIEKGLVLFQLCIYMWGILLPVFYITQLQAQSLDFTPLITPGKKMVQLPTIKAELADLGCNQGSAKTYSYCVLSLLISEVLELP